MILNNQTELLKGKMMFLNITNNILLFRFVLSMVLRTHEGNEAQVCFFIIQVVNIIYLIFYFMTILQLIS